MRKDSLASLVLGLLGTVLFTCLLLTGRISESCYVVLMVPLALVCIVLLCLPRLRELDLKNLRMVLSEIRQAKAEIEQMYGGIENLRRAPLLLDDAKMQQLGLNPGGIPRISAVMRYTAGCMKRERERLARIFVQEKQPQKIAEAILDNSLDDGVFKWSGPESSLDKPPHPIAEEQKDKGAEQKSAE